MAGSKRMSMEEKRQVILGIYHTTKQVYTEKEILTLATKAGVNQGTVADVNQALVDDGLVEKEKIGGSNYFWSFPAKKDRLIQIQHQQTLEQVTLLQEQVQRKSQELEQVKRGREDDDGQRPQKLLRLAEIQKETVILQQELATLQENDPKALADLEKEFKLCKQAAERWTDNIFNIQAYLIKKRGMDKKDVNKMLQIKSDFDYPVDKP